MAEKTFVMTSKRTAKLLTLSLAFICMGFFLNYAAAKGKITGMAATGALGNADLAYAYIGIIIAMAISLFVVYISENKKI